MSKSMVWKLVAGAFVLNAVGLFWIKNELVKANAVPRIDPIEEGLRVRIVEPRVQAEKAERLLIVFNQDLASGGQLGEEVGWSPFEIEPAVEGVWRWHGRNAMEYRLFDPLPKGNEIKLKASARLNGKLGRPLLGKSEFTLQTSPLEVERWYELGQRDGRFEIELRFNQEVEPTVLDDYLKVADSGGRPLKREVRENGRRRLQVLSIEQPEGRVIDLTLKKGLPGVEGPNGLERDFKKRITLLPSFAFMRAKTPWRLGTTEKSSVELRFNKTIDLLQQKPVVTVIPEIESLSVTLIAEGIRLYGNFDSMDRHFVAKIGSDLRSADGEVLPAGSRIPFVMPKRYPSVSFNQNQGVLSPKGNLEIGLKTCSISNVRLSATKIYPNNLASHLRGFARYEPGLVGKDLFSTVKGVGTGGNLLYSSVINLRDWIEKPLGLYCLKASDEEYGWRNDRTVVAVTDLMITTKSYPRGVLSWVTSLSEGKPVEGARVSVLSSKNQLIAEGLTDSSGLVELEAPEDHPEGAPWVVLAQKQEDLSFRRLDQRKWDLPKVAKDGREPLIGLDGFIYAARGVRRPGELVRLTGIVRDQWGKEPDLNTPFELRVFRPDGKMVKSISIRLAPGGLFHHNFQTPVAAWTGSWKFSLFLPGTDREIATLKTGVEAFVPVRLEVVSESVSSLFGLADPPEVMVSSRYLFGVGASNLPLRVGGTWEPASFTAAGLEEYAFGVADSSLKVAFDSISAITDEEGEALVFPSTERLTPGFWRGTGYVSVTTPGGGTVSDSFELDKLSAKRLVGIRVAQGGGVRVDETFAVELLAVEPMSDEVSVGDVELVLQRIETDWVNRKVNGTWTWVERTEAVEFSRLRVEGVGGVATPSQVGLLCPESGSWQIEVRDLVGGALSKFSFEVIRPGEPKKSGSPHRVALVADRSYYKPGEAAGISIDAPFAGQLLLTLESDRVLWSRSIEMPAGKVEMEVPLPSSMPGGAFLTASVVRPLDPESKDWKPHRAYGMIRLDTDSSSRRIDLALDHPFKVRPGSEVEVEARVRHPGHAFVHIWAVDEGVLSVTDYKTPSPKERFYGPWRSKVDSGDLYLELFEDYKRPGSMERFGAGGGALRQSLVKSTPRSSVVLWNEFIPVDGDGKVRKKFHIPEDFTGELRFMGVVVEGNSFGSAQSKLTVSSPLLAELSLPSFVAPGDRFLSPVTFFNSTAGPLQVKASFDVFGPARLLGDGRKVIAVPAGGSSTDWFELQADRSMGTVSITVTASGGDQSVKATGAFPVRPAATLDAAYETFVLEAGKARAIKPPARFLAPGLKRSITLSSSPVSELVPALEELLAFPYGCVEQTTSKVMPMIYASVLLDGGKAEFSKEAVKEGIKRLEMMQTRSGGLSYWPGGSEPNLWGTCYASQFLMEAKQAGYEIGETFLQSLSSYLRKALRSGEYNLNEQAFICQVLASFGKPENARQRYLLDKIDALDLAGHGRLAGAWLASGRPDLARKCLRQEAFSQKVSRTFKNRLTSDAAACSVMLSVLLDLDKKHPWVTLLKERILSHRRKSRWPSTLDNGLALVSLCKLHATEVEQEGEFVGTLTDSNGDEYSFSSDSPYLKTLSGLGVINLTSSGKGKIFVSVKTEGLVSPESVKPVDRGIEARRRWLNAEGEVIRDWNSLSESSATVSVGDLVWVEVMLKSKGAQLENVALVDALPGGFTVENPRLATSVVRFHGSGVSLKASKRPDRTDFLDDRVVLFATARTNSQLFRYAIRAVAGGEFFLPGIQASCMYDETLHSIGQSGSVQVAVP